MKKESRLKWGKRGVGYVVLMSILVGSVALSGCGKEEEKVQPQRPTPPTPVQPDWVAQAKGIGRNLVDVEGWEGGEIKELGMTKESGRVVKYAFREYVQGKKQVVVQIMEMEEPDALGEREKIGYKEDDEGKYEETREIDGYRVWVRLSKSSEHGRVRIFLNERLWEFRLEADYVGVEEMLTFAQNFSWAKIEEEAKKQPSSRRL